MVVPFLTPNRAFVTSMEARVSQHEPVNLYESLSRLRRAFVYQKPFTLASVNILLDVRHSFNLLCCREGAVRALDAIYKECQKSGRQDGILAYRESIPLFQKFAAACVLEKAKEFIELNTEQDLQKASDLLGGFMNDGVVPLAWEGMNSVSDLERLVDHKYEALCASHRLPLP